MLFERLFVPAEIPTEFAGPLAELRASLASPDEASARNVLEEAQARFDEANARITSAETRATALQGNVAIAASLVVAGAGLFLDSGKVASDEWRTVLVLVLVGFVLCLVASAWRAVSVTGRVFEFEQPGTERIVERAALSAADAITFRAAELLRAGSVSSEIGAIKIGLLRSAAWWFRLALGTLGVFIALLATYVVSSPLAVSGSTPVQERDTKRTAGRRPADLSVSPETSAAHTDEEPADGGEHPSAKPSTPISPQKSPPATTPAKSYGRPAKSYGR